MGKTQLGSSLGCVTLGGSFSLSEPHFFICHMGIVTPLRADEVCENSESGLPKAVVMLLCPFLRHRGGLAVSLPFKIPTIRDPEQRGVTETCLKAFLI